MSQEGSERIITKASIQDKDLQMDLSIIEIPENVETFKNGYSQQRLKNQNMENDESFEHNVEISPTVHSKQ